MDCIWTYASPLGEITLASEGEALCGLWFVGQKHYAAGLSPERAEKELPVFVQTARWLDLYFGGQEPDFTPPLAPRGSPFRLAVWELLRSIPYGCTLSYGQLAARLSGERGPARVSPRAVGGAVAHNPISLLIPCHRVLGADGSLTGYAAGPERKLWLLRREGILL